MSTSNQTSARGHKRGNGGRAERRRSRDLAGITRERKHDERRVAQAQLEHAARQRRAGAEQRTRQHQRIIDLLRRGAGVSQILREIGQPNDTLADSVRRATSLRQVLLAVAAGSSEARRLRIEPRDMQRIAAYLDGCICLLQDEIARQAAKAKMRRTRRRRSPRRAPATVAQTALR